MIDPLCRRLPLDITRPSIFVHLPVKSETKRGDILERSILCESFLKFIQLPCKPTLKALLQWQFYLHQNLKIRIQSRPPQLKEQPPH